MLSSLRKTTAIVFFAATVASVAGTASAAPVADGVAIRNAAPRTVETVWWGWWGPAAGFAAGAIIGGALAAPYYYPRYITVMGRPTMATHIMGAAITHQPRPPARAMLGKLEAAARSASGPMIRRRAPISDMTDSAILARDPSYLGDDRAAVLMPKFYRHGAAHMPKGPVDSATSRVPRATTRLHARESPMSVPASPTAGLERADFSAE